MIPSNNNENSLDSQTQTFLSNCLQDQWTLETSEKGSFINSSPKFHSNFQHFLPNKYIWISTEEDLISNWDKISCEKVLGMDIEQTFHNSYFGYICLIQISTPYADYIFDVLSLKAKIKAYLQSMLENPKIIKIFYSGDNDLFWLQRDFSLKVSNFFDVKIAALFLNKTIDCSLPHLIETFCESGKMDKKRKKILQVSPWFQRPLTEDQMNYAAMDSHYLIGLREKLLTTIFEKTQDVNSIIGLFERMEAITTKKYHTKEFNRLEFFDLFNKNFKGIKTIISNKKEEKKEEEEKKTEIQDEIKDKKKAQFSFIKIAELRDEKARERNLGLEEILTTNTLFELSKGEKKLEELQNSKQITDKDHEFIKENLVIIQELFKIKKSVISEELEKIQSTNKTNTQFERERKKQERLKMMEGMFIRKSPAYENCSILAPDGYLLCHCDQKKVNWYITRNLAKPVTEDNKTIKLLFEPQGRGFSEMEFIDNKFYTVDRDNQCVVCGNKDKYLKYHIVPALYRQHFPNSFKSHRSHDVVLLCLECHEKANKETENLKMEIAKKFDCPLTGKNNPLLTLRNKLLTMAKFGLSFWKNKESIPKERKKFLKAELRSYFSELQKEDKIKKFLEISDTPFNFNKENLIKIDEKFFNMCKGINKNHKRLKESSNKDFKNLHGKLVVEKLNGNEELKDFILMWRKNFVDRLNPKFLPSAWNVYHQFERKFGDFSKFHENHVKK